MWVGRLCEARQWRAAERIAPATIEPHELASLNPCMRTCGPPLLGGSPGVRSRAFFVEYKLSRGAAFCKLRSTLRATAPLPLHARWTPRNVRNACVSFPFFRTLGKENFLADYDQEVLMKKSRFTETQIRSEEHTSELQSRENLVCRLLLEKKNKTHK